MGAKLYADTATYELVITETPVSGVIDIDVQVDVWSDLNEDWNSTLALRRFTFPLEAIGGQTISSGKLGTTYVLAEPWQIAPYEGDHDLNIDGNLFTELAATKLVKPTVGAYTVTVNRNLSTLVELAETELNATAVSDIAMARKYLTNRQILSDGTSGNLVTYDDDDVAVLLTQSVTDEGDAAVAVGAGDPAKRSKGV